MSKDSSNINSIDLLVQGLLGRFTDLRELEVLITNLTIKQDELIGKSIQELKFYQFNDQIAEISLMVTNVKISFAVVLPT